MTKRFNYTYEQPSSIGYIQSEVLEKIALLEPSKQGAAIWSAGFSKRMTTHGNTRSILGPVTKKLEDYVTTELGLIPRSISYDFDNRPALPGLTQRGIGWHVDAGKASHVMVTSNAIPTEFLVADDDSRLADLRRIEILDSFSDEPGSMFNTELIEKGVEEGVFKIYQPDPYEAVILTKHIHRSTKTSVT